MARKSRKVIVETSTKLRYRQDYPMKQREMWRERQ